MNNKINDDFKLSNKGNHFTVIKIIFLLMGLQIIRIILKQIAFLFFHHNKFNDVLISIIIIFILTLFIIYKSKQGRIILDIFSYMRSKESKIYYFMVTGAILLLIFTSPFFIRNPSIETLLYLLYITIMIPIYEEIIFRSYIWNILKKENINEIKIYILTTLLFSFYHIGYIDTVIAITGFNNMALITFIKCSLMLSYGIFIGFFKYKIKNSYSCMLVHSFINIFGG